MESKPKPTVEIYGNCGHTWYVPRAQLSDMTKVNCPRCDRHFNADPSVETCGEEHLLLCSDPEGERPLRCGLPKGHEGPHQDERTLR
jgi:hypothetical protein